MTDFAVAQAVPMDSMPFVNSHVTVIDATGSPAMPEMSVEVLDHRIVAIEGTQTFLVPDTLALSMLLVSSSFQDCGICMRIPGAREYSSRSISQTA